MHRPPDEQKLHRNCGEKKNVKCCPILRLRPPAFAEKGIFLFLPLLFFVMTFPVSAAKPLPADTPQSQLNTGNNKKADTEDAHAAQAEKLIRKLKSEVRQGNEQAARATIRNLAALKPQPENHVLSELADFLIDRERWALAKYFLEECPQSAPGWGYVLVRHMIAEAGKDGRKIDAIDIWLKQRLPANIEYWTTLRAGFAEETRRETQFFSELETSCLSHPDDLEAIRRYLSLSSSHSSGGNVAWISNGIQPRLAWDNYRLAEWLRARYPAEAIAYLEKAGKMPFTPADEKAIDEFMRRNTAMPGMLPHDWRKEFSQWVRLMLAGCYEKTGRSQQAQALLVELSRENGGQMPTLALTQFAGQVQSRTPLHPLETQIKKAEAPNENSVEYWQGRARYYEGRKDYAAQNEALLKALRITELNVSFDNNKIMCRSIVTWDYARYLKARRGDAAALSFFWNEFDKNRTWSYRKIILRDIQELLETDITHYLSPTDERLWAFLKESKQWDFSEEKLLWRMARNAESSQKPAFWQKAENLASGEGSREKVLGWIMNRCNEPGRSLSLLQAASRHLSGEKRQDACFTLFESYLDLSDWQNAEKIWPEASRQLTEHEMPDWLGRIAVAAARRGAKSEALRLWQEKDRIDFAAIQHLDELKTFGMKSELIKYYNRLKRERPSSSVPEEALKKLGG